MSEERDLLADGRRRRSMEASRGRWVLGLGSAALILLLVFASVVIERETVRREEITQALRRHADLLEQAHDSLVDLPAGGRHRLLEPRRGNPLWLLRGRRRWAARATNFSKPIIPWASPRLTPCWSVMVNGREN